MLSVRGLTKRFGGLVAVDSCTFEVRERAVTALVGANGAGKTTVFNLITGTLQPDSGRVLLDDMDLTRIPTAQRTSRGVARTFQDVRLFGEMTVLDNVMVAVPRQPGESLGRVIFTPRSARRHQRATRAKARAALARAGFSGADDTPARSLSFGEQKVVAIARLLATEASYLLLDEPASGLDEPSIDRLCALIRSLAGDGHTVLLVEHNTAVVRRLADWIVFLDAGRPVVQGEPDRVLSSDEYRMSYLGSGA